MPERQDDLSLRGLLVGAGIVVAGIALSFAAAALVILEVGAPATGASEGEPPEIEGAPLRTAAREDLHAYLREKKARLASYGRVDAEHVHIPIERAMQILARRGER